jgi:hypothetical protein
MCLIIDKSITKPPKKKYMWKAVYKDMSPPCKYSSKKYRLGQWYNSNRKSKEIQHNELTSDGRWRYVENGIHVVYTRDKARFIKNRYADCDNGVYCILKVEVQEKDWIASNNNGYAAYMKVKPISIVR